MKAWLITWDWANDAAAVADAVVGILNPRWSSRRVADTVELLYATATSNLSELAAYGRRRNNNPYPAKIDFNSHVHCGHNPMLYARIVDKLTITLDQNTGFEKIAWEELPLYEATEEGPQEVRGRLRMSFQRRRRGPVSNELVWDREAGRFRRGWDGHEPAVIADP